MQKSLISPMGHGASTNVKKLTIKQSVNGQPRKTGPPDESAGGCRPLSSPAKLGWTRSNSDGCIVENLNTSKTKTELLEQQVEEFRELFQHAEQKAEEAQEQAKILELQMAEVEGTNFELMDRVTELEQQLEESRNQTLPEEKMEYSRNLEEQNQIIEKQEQQIQNLEEALSKIRIKLKKRLRSAKMELAESKQEAGLKMYSLKDQISSLQEKNTRLVEHLDRAHSLSSAQSRRNMPCPATPDSRKVGGTSEGAEPEEQWEDSRTKVILELSSRLSAQEQRLCELEDAVQEKDNLIRSLQQQRGLLRPPSGSQKAQRSSQSTEICSEPSCDDSSNNWANDDDVALTSSEKRHRKSSSRSRKSSQNSSGQISIPSKMDKRNTSAPTESDVEDYLRSFKGTEENPGRDSLKNIRQPSANSVDSEMSDRSDSNRTKSTSANSSRHRRRVKNQLPRQSSADKKNSRTEMVAFETRNGVEGRDSGIGIPDSLGT